MAKTADQKNQPQSSSSKKDTEKEKTIFIRTRQRLHHLYAIPAGAIGTPTASEEELVGGKTKLRPFSIIPSILSPSSSACVGWDSSIIYVFNGGHTNYGREVLYLDTRNPNEGWKRGPSMNAAAAKPQPYAMVVGGKIYVVGSLGKGSSNNNDQQQQPWGEILDPLLNEWSVLAPHPGLVSSDISSHAVLDEGKKILFHPDCHPSSLYLYDTDAKSWEIIDKKFGHTRGLIGQESSPCVILDNILYYYYEDQVHAYDLLTRKWLAEPVRGLDQYKRMLLPMQKSSSCCESRSENAFLVDLGNGRLCLIWENSRSDEYGWRKYVRCTKFRVIKHGGDDRGEDMIILHALIESFSEYSFHNKDEEILGCFAL